MLTSWEFFADFTSNSLLLVSQMVADDALINLKAFKVIFQSFIMKRK